MQKKVRDEIRAPHGLHSLEVAALDSRPWIPWNFTLHRCPLHVHIIYRGLSAYSHFSEICKIIELIKTTHQDL